MKVPYELKNTDFVIGQISQLYAADPVGALKEYVTNSIDAFSDASLKGQKIKARIGVVINKEDGTVTVQDNALGMSYDFLSQIPRSIGESSRRGIKEMRGEKAFGMLAYCGFGQSADVLTRTSNDNGSYSNLVMRRDELSADVGRLESRVVKAAVRFDTGTRVTVSGVPRKTIEDYFTPQKLKHALGETYEPLLRSNEVEIYVGWHGRNERLEKVEPSEHKGEPVLSDLSPTSKKIIRLGNGSHVAGELEVNLWLNPDGLNEKVGFYSKGVRAFDNIGKLKELDDLWSSGKLGGYVNANFVSLTPERAGVIRDSGFECLVDMLKAYEPKLRELVKIAEARAVKNRADSVLKQISEQLGIVYSKRPNPFTKGTGKPIETPRTPSDNPRKPRKPVCPYVIDITEFNPIDANRRFKLEEDNWILINSGHRDFGNLAFGRNAKDKQALQYFADVIASGSAFADYLAGRKAMAKATNEKLDSNIQMSADVQQAIAERTIELKLGLLESFGIIKKGKKEE